MGYTLHVIKGLSWMAALRVVFRAIGFMRIAILARLLTPEQFGLFGIATLVLSLLEILTETGINIFLVQAKNDIEKYIDAAWIISVGRGIVISLTIFLLSPLIASFFHAKETIPLLQLLSFVPFIKGFINPAEIQFQKQLQFSKEFYFRSGLYLIEMISAILLVLATHSISSLIWALIISSIFEVVFSYSLIKQHPTLKLEINKIKEIITHGKWVTSTGIFNYFFHNGDNIVVGKILGLTSLAYYDNAYKISMLPITEIGNVIQQVTLPIYTKFHDDRDRLWKAFIKMMGLITVLTIPIGIIFMLYPRDIILIILGSQWLPAAPVLQVLTVFGVARAISGTPSALFYSIGKQNYVTIITFVSFISLAVTIIPFTYWFGLLGAGYSAIFATVAAIPVIIYFTFKVFNSNHVEQDTR